MTEIAKRRAIRRLRLIAGQIRGLERMVERDAYCIDVIHQSLAIQEALSSFEAFMLEHHLKTHVIQQIKAGEERKAIREILSICKLSKRA